MSMQTGLQSPLPALAGCLAESRQLLLLLPSDLHRLPGYSFSEFPHHLWVMADRVDTVQRHHRLALPALSQPHIWRWVAPDHTSDCCGDSDTTAVASLRCRSEDGESNRDRL